MMRKLLCTGLLAVSVGLSPVGSAPAKALEGEQLFGLIAGLAALAVISDRLNDERRDKVEKKPQVRMRASGHAYAPRNHVRHNRKPQVRKTAFLPRNCLRNADTNRGFLTVAGARCLARNNVSVRALPNRCYVRAFAGGRQRDAFSGRCLKRAGYRFDARGRRY